MTTAEQTAPAAATDPTNEILKSLETRIQPVRVGFGYRLGLMVVLATMILLPLIYIAIIAAVAYVMMLHATGSLVGHIRGPRQLLLLYVGPLLVGGVLLLFMIKPLFARRPKSLDPLNLSPQREPLLFAFIQRLARTVGAPVPKEIRVDIEVNASAGFRRGMWSFFGNDLVLTVGLPLLENMSVREIGGVIAHEFGHFAQGAGMRATYVVRSINAWFSRVVYERDAWDEWLVQMTEEGAYGFILANLARLFVWLTRWVLWILMILGHAVSCVMLRQMEFDADRYEARVSGSDTFETSQRKLPLLSVSSQAAYNDLSRMVDEEKLPESFPALIAHNLATMPAEVRKAIGKHIDTERTELLSTHPASKDRIASAHRENAPGILRSDLPAKTLLRHYDAIARQVSMAHYQDIIGRRVKHLEVIAVGETLQELEQQQEQAKAVARVTQGVGGVLRPLPLQIDASLPQPSSLDAARRHVKKLREDLQEQAPAWGRAFQRYDELDTRRTTLHLVHMLGRANISVPPESVALKDTSSAAVAREKARVDQKLAVDDKKLTPAEALAAARISRTLAALKAEDAPERIPEAAFLLEETDKLLRALQTLGRQIDAVVEVRDAFRGLTVLVENAQESENPAVATTAVSEMRILQRRLKAVYDSIGGVPYPFAKAGEKREMRHYLFSPLARLQSSDNSFEVAADVLDRYGTIYQRIMGQLCVVVEQIEAQMGLTPLPEPKDAEEDDEDEAQARTS